MRWRVEAHVGADQHARADGDGGAVEKAGVAVDVGPGRHAQLRAVLDRDWRDDVGVLREIGIIIVLFWRRGGYV